LKFFYSPGSCALATHITLAEVNADYEPIRVDFGNVEQSADAYLAINPKGRVPALVTDAGILTETPAILLYLAQCYPQAAIAPLADPFALARVQAFNSYLCATVHVAHAHGARGHRWANEAASLADMKAKVPETMAACLDLIEDEYIRGPWVMGDQFTICDPYLLTISNWLERDDVDRSLFPKVDAHAEMMMERPRTRAAWAEHFA
jgi:glutathione S-transferase